MRISQYYFINDFLEGGLLSGGQRQALTLWMATLVKPRILLLDVAGSEKAAMSVEDLLEQFYKVRGEEFVPDRMLLV